MKSPKSHRAFCAVLAALMLLTLVPFAASAKYSEGGAKLGAAKSKSAYFEMEIPSSCSEGETLTVKTCLKNAAGFFAGTVDLFWDPDVFELTSATKGPADRASFNNEQKKGQSRCAMLFSDECKTSSMDIAVYQFKVLSGAGKSTAEFRVAVAKNDFAGVNAPSTLTKSIRIQKGATSDVMTGDVDGNGKVTAADARLVLRMAAGLLKPTDRQKKAADADADNVVRAADARKILRVAAKLDSFGKAPNTTVPTTKPTTVPTTKPTTVTTTRPTTVTTTKPASEFLTATNADFDDLGTDFDADSLLNAMSYTFFREKKVGSGYRAVTDYTAGSRSTKSNRDYLFFLTYSMIYIHYFGMPERVTYKASNDPFSDLYLSDHVYLKYPEKKLNWVLKNVLNTNEINPREFVSDLNYCAYRDGYFYFADFGYGFDSRPGGRIISKERLSDGRYSFTIGYFYYDYDLSRALSDTGTLIAGLKEIDGKRVWSIYSYKADLRL
ncbi:MAG: hypothetical protein IJK23_04115 [Clostridia bacterium]|nr:hypothetical protein [Clostridia bacterium]